jgi:hypothetical protein
MNPSASTEALLASTALKAWDTSIRRAGKTFDALTDEQMLTPIVPGKNRPIYLFGHLLVVSDSMIPQLRLGDAQFPALREPFVVQPDGAVADLPPIAELRQNWKDVHLRLDELFEKLTPADWLERHATVSEEDFATEPHRNRLAILLSRTSHLAYHLGQLAFLKK